MARIDERKELPKPGWTTGLFGTDISPIKKSLPSPNSTLSLSCSLRGATNTKSQKEFTCEMNSTDHSQAEPIDLSMRKSSNSPATESDTAQDARNDPIDGYARANFTATPTSKNNMPLVPMDGSRYLTHPQLHNRISNPTYVPGSIHTHHGRLPFPTNAIPPIWHPSLLMSQAARQYSAGLLTYPFHPSANISGAFPGSSSLSHLYSHNLLAHFSRIYHQKKRLHESENLTGTRPGVGDSKGPLSDGVRAIAICDAIEKSDDDVRTELRSLTINERKPNEYLLPRKRKCDGSVVTENLFHSQSKAYSPDSENRQFAKERRSDHSQHDLQYPDSPPSMVARQSTVTSDNSRLIPKPVDFKPCRFPCSECGRTYATVGGLLKHSKTHHNPDNNNHFKCKTCDKEYNSLGALKMHIRTHTLPCKCHICGKAFSRTWLLQGHIRTHTGEKPYQCTVCSRAFADRSNLRAHMQTHESVKRYACTSCDKTFSRISLLNRHQVGGCTGTP